MTTENEKRSPARRWISALLGATMAALLSVWWSSRRPAPPPVPSTSEKRHDPAPAASPSEGDAAPQAASGESSESPRPRLEIYPREQAQTQWRELVQGEPNLSRLAASPLVRAVHRGEGKVLLTLSSRALELAETEEGRAEIESSLARYVAPLGVGTVVVRIENEGGSIVPLSKAGAPELPADGPRQGYYSEPTPDESETPEGSTEP